MSRIVSIDSRRKVFRLGLRQSRALEATQRATAPPTGPGDDPIGPGACRACGGRCWFGNRRWWHELEDGGFRFCTSPRGSEAPHVP